MENILAIAEGSITSEITSFDLIDHNVFQELIRSGTFMKYQRRNI